MHFFRNSLIINGYEIHFFLHFCGLGSKNMLYSRISLVRATRVLYNNKERVCAHMYKVFSDQWSVFSNQLSVFSVQYSDLFSV